MLNLSTKITKRNAVKAAVTVAANALVCQAVEETIGAFSDADEDTVHYIALGVGTGIYFGRWHDSLMRGIDRVADRRIARKEEKAAVSAA